MLKKEFNRIIAAGIYPFIVLCIMWVVFVVDIVMGLHLSDSYGLVPRTEHGLIGIIAMPFLHGSLNHIMSNSLPFLISFWCVMYFYRSVAFEVVMIIYLGTGLATWAVARQEIHVGASGVVYGFISFVLASGFMRRNRTLLALALIMVFMYGGLVWYAMPWVATLSISWEGHLCGAIMGFVSARLFRNEGPPDDRIYPEEDEAPPDWWLEAHQPPPHITYHIIPPFNSENQHH